VARPTFVPEDTTSFFVKITDKNACVLMDTVKVNVVPGIDLKFEFSKVTDCYSRAALRVVNNTNSMDEQYFDFGDGNTSKENEILYNYKADGNYHVKLVGKKEFCVYEESVDLPFFTIRVPNVITPGNADANSTGRNDFFRIIYGEQGNRSTSDVGLSVSLSIYNRWGKVVYKNEAYDDSWAGEGLEAGVYYYDVNIENEPVCKGWVQIIR
jgi:hypothetical protein